MFQLLHNLINCHLMGSNNCNDILLYNHFHSFVFTKISSTSSSLTQKSYAILMYVYIVKDNTKSMCINATHEHDEDSE